MRKYLPEGAEKLQVSQLSRGIALFVW